MVTYVYTRFRECCQETENSRLPDVLRQNPDVPFSIEELAEMLGRTRHQIKNAVEDLEGPITSDVPGAFVHFWRLTGEAVYLP
jgi:hypothetical protein